MSAIHMVVEGSFDAALWRRLFANLPAYNQIQYHVARGRNRAPSWARRLQVDTDDPVILVMDADTNDVDAAELNKGDLRAYLAYTGAGSNYFVELFVPEIEVLFFHLRPSEEAALFGKEMESSYRVAGRYAPKEILSKLTKTRSRSPSFVDSIPDVVIDRMRTHRVPYDVRDFVEKRCGTSERR